MEGLPDRTEMYRAGALEIIKDAFAHGTLTTEELERRTELIENARSIDEIESSMRDLTILSTPPESLQPAISCVLGSRHVRRSIASFQRTRLTGILSETKIDMRGSRPDDLPVAGDLELFVVMGSVEIIIPPDTVTDLEVVPVMANVEEHGKQSRSLDPPRLRITGTVIMGNVEIRRRPTRPVSR